MHKRILKQYHSRQRIRSLIPLSLLVGISLSTLPGCIPWDALLPLWEPSTVNESTIPENPISEVVRPALDIRPVGGQSGVTDTEADLKTLSQDFEVRLKNPTAGAQSADIGLPIVAEELPADWDPVQLQPEIWEPESQRWKPAGHFSWYDTERQTVWFRHNLSGSDMSTQQNVGGQRFRIRIYLFSNLRTVQREGSHFRIHYYPTHLANASKVVSDAVWGSPGLNEASEIPNFIEDLDQALSQTYTRLLQQQSSNGAVFQSLPEQDVYVLDTGSSAGNSNLGGPMRISNRLISNLQDLRLTAAHELVHVFQGQHYSLQGLFTGRYNHWFIEASANYYAEAVNHLDDSSKATFYGDFFSDYLSVSLNSSHDNSMYAAGHFLDWLSARYGNTLVGDALHLSKGNDLMGLSEALRQHDTSLSDAYTEYVQSMLTAPEDTAGFHAQVRNAMGNHALGYGYLSGSLLNDKRTYITLNKPLGVYSSVLTSLRLNNSDDALLVVETDGSTGSLLKGLAYGLESDQNSDFANTRPVDKNTDPTSSPFFTIPHAGSAQPITALNHLLLNASPASQAQVKARYYLLRPPLITQQDDTRLSWSLQSLGNLPMEQLQGFKIYREDSQGKRQELLPLQPIARGRSEQSVKIERARFGSDNALVTVVDKWGNEWPASDQPVLNERICTASFRLNDASNQIIYTGLTSHFQGNWKPEGFESNQMWCPEDQDCPWGPGNFSTYENYLHFKLSKDENWAENLALRIDPGNGYYEELNVSGRIPRVQSGSQSIYRLTGSAACQQVSYSSGHPNPRSARVYNPADCNSASVFQLVCEADYPGRTFSYDYVAK